MGLQIYTHSIHSMGPLARLQQQQQQQQQQ
jgi:hypothetical protein